WGCIRDSSQIARHAMSRLWHCQGERHRALRHPCRVRTIADPELSPRAFPCLTQLHGRLIRPHAAMPATILSIKRWVSRINGDTQMYAVIVTGGKQYKVAEGEYLKIENLEVPTGEAVTFDRVLLVGN